MIGPIFQLERKMTYPAGSIPVWFNRGRASDEQYLQAWRDAPLTFDSERVVDHYWNADHYEIVLGQIRPVIFSSARQ